VNASAYLQIIEAKAPVDGTQGFGWFASVEERTKASFYSFQSGNADSAHVAQRFS
jgi:hypothetical protein